jgi:hypothetical protein
MALKTEFERCYESHEALPIGKYFVYGGSASYPIVNDADIYVSLQGGSTCGLISDPWDIKHVIEIQLPITDMCAPSNLARFKKMIDWLSVQLIAGKKIHVGCIGGHGRTGIVLSALVAKMMPEEKDAIGYVRKNYCKKVVESNEQVNFLVKNFGVKAVTSTKGSVSFSKHSGAEGWESMGSKFSVSQKEMFDKVNGYSDKRSRSVTILHPVASARNIWRELSK